MVTQGRETPSSANESLWFRPFRLDLQEQRLWRGDHPVPLKPRALAILKCLLERPGQLFTHQELLARFWGDGHLSEGVLKTQIAELRQALAESARDPRFIETVHRRGYRFIGQIEPSAAFATPAAQAVPFGVDHFVGREPELEWLAERWARACSGERQTVFVTGEAGVGKTVLVNTFLPSVPSAEDGALICWGQCIDQYGAGEPYLPIVEALRRACAEAEDSQVADCLRQFAPGWLPVLSSVARPLAGDVAPLAPALPGRMLREMAEALEALSQQRPLLLLIEDLHWADYSTLDLIAYLGQRSDAARLLLLSTHRPSEAREGRLADVVDRLKSRGRSAELSVPLLSQRAVGEYLASRFDAHQLPQAVQELVHERTEGYALFMVGLIDDWLLRGLVTESEGRCELQASLDELAHSVPDNFVRMVEKDLARSSPLERMVLEAASVAGNEFSAAAVAAALSEELVRVEEVCLGWARRGQFLRSMGAAEWRDGTIAECFRFRHVLHQQITYEQLGAARQARWHQRVGERLEAGFVGEADSIAAELALHFQRSRDWGRAVHYSKSAGDRALRRGAYREAIDHLSRALELLAKLPPDPKLRELELALLLLQATPLRMAKGFGAAELEQTYTRAEQLCQHDASPERRFLVMAGQGALHLTREEHPSALALGRHFLLLAASAGNLRARADAHSVVGAACHFMGQHHDAVPHLEQAITLYDAEPASVLSSTTIDLGQSARGMRALSIWMTGHVDRARRHAEENLERSLATENPFAAAYALIMASAVFFHCQQLDEAVHYARRGGALGADQKLDMLASIAQLREGMAHVARGDHRSGLELMEHARSGYARTGSRAYSDQWTLGIAWAHYGLGQSSQALQVLREARRESRPELRLSGPELLRLEGQILAEQERPDDAGSPSAAVSYSAESCFSRALELARQQGAKSFELRAGTSLARYWHGLGRTTQAHALLSPIYAWFSEGHDTGDLKSAKALLEELEGAG